MTAINNKKTDSSPSDQKKEGTESVNHSEQVKKHQENTAIEEFIINNPNGNGINPTPMESGNSPEWDKGIQQSKDYEDDSTQ